MNKWISIKEKGLPGITLYAIFTDGDGVWMGSPNKATHYLILDVPRLPNIKYQQEKNCTTINKEYFRTRFEMIISEWMLDHNGCYNDRDDQNELINNLMKCFDEEK